MVLLTSPASKDDLALRHAILVHRIQSLQAIPRQPFGAPVLLRRVLQRNVWVSEDRVLELKSVDGIFSTIVVIEASRWSMWLASAKVGEERSAG